MGADVYRTSPVLLEIEWLIIVILRNLILVFSDLNQRNWTWRNIYVPMRWKQTWGIEKVANYGESTVSPSDRQQCSAENPASFISWWMTWLIFFTTKWIQPFLVKGCRYVNYWYGYLLIVIISYATEKYWDATEYCKKDIWNKCFVLYVFS